MASLGGAVTTLNFNIINRLMGFEEKFDRLRYRFLENRGSPDCLGIPEIVQLHLSELVFHKEPGQQQPHDCDSEKDLYSFYCPSW